MIYFWQKKWSFVLFCLFQYFVRFWLTFKKIEALIELRKMLLRKKLFDTRFGNCLTPIRYPDFADLLDLQRCD